MKAEAPRKFSTPLLLLLAAGLALTALPGCHGKIEINGVPVKAAVNVNEAHETVQKRFAADQVQRLDVDAGMGEIEVQAGDATSNVILIRATKYVTGNRPVKELATYLPKVPVTAALKGNALMVRSESDDDSVWLPMKGRGLQSYVSYVITVPKRLALELNTSSGDIKVEQIDGGVNAETGSGAIALQSVAGSLNLKTASGAVTVHDAPGADEVSVTTASGSAELKNIAGRVQGHTASGDFSIDGARIDQSLTLESSSGSLKCDNIHSASSQLDLKLTSASGDIAYRGDAGRIDAHTSSGNLDLFTPSTLPLTAVNAESISGNLNLTLPGLTSAQIDAHSASGTLSLPMGRGSATGNDDAADQHTVTVVLGNGTTHITLNSSSGDITLANTAER